METGPKPTLVHSKAPGHYSLRPHHGVFGVKSEDSPVKSPGPGSAPVNLSVAKPPHRENSVTAVSPSKGSENAMGRAPHRAQHAAITRPTARTVNNNMTMTIAPTTLAEVKDSLHQADESYIQRECGMRPLLLVQASSRISARLVQGWCNRERVFLHLCLHQTLS